MRKALLYFFGLLSVVASAQERVVTPHVSPSLRFTENIGQWDNFIRYRVQLDGGLLFMEKDGLTYNLYDKKMYRTFHMGGLSKSADKSLKAHAIKVQFVGCNKFSVTSMYCFVLL